MCDNWNELSHLACATRLTAATRSAVAPRNSKHLKGDVGIAEGEMVGNKVGMMATPPTDIVSISGIARTPPTDIVSISGIARIAVIPSQHSLGTLPKVVHRSA